MIPDFKDADDREPSIAVALALRVAAVVILVTALAAACVLLR